ncbi:FAD-dependent oxidoreductase [Streptomyces albicerus]|jgi:flavin-dependent dehydrogenase|uniref:FAD-dependent oxidoreductase n=1 Tax=Streptomyces albicerus TaxID=2569859 RepID=UPI00124B1FE1|nr:FAD-dependent oxidoreductase [Streptomyces albicerus]
MTETVAATVAVVGGGYGGIAAATALDDVADVVLIEPRDAFVHNVAALRGLVDPGWTDRLFFPYDRLLKRGRVLRDRATRVDAAGITLGSGQRITADYIILATGSSYPPGIELGTTAVPSVERQIRRLNGRRWCQRSVSSVLRTSVGFGG